MDFGGQRTQLIARGIRELGVYSEILPCTEPVDGVLGGGYAGIALSGGPSSVYEDEAPLPDKRLLESTLPLLGICYGMKAMGYLMGGHVVPASVREYGKAHLLMAALIHKAVGDQLTCLFVDNGLCGRSRWTG